MWLVQYALKFRITFYVMSILILLAGVGAYFMMPNDVLPQVNIPVVTVVWTFTGLDTPEMKSGSPPIRSFRSATTSMASAIWRARRCKA
jgi:multidrug efflux pump subunit AcrB